MRRLPGLPAALALGVAAMAFATPARADLLISVDKADQQMTVVVDGVPRYIWPVSTGAAGYNTPSGSFRPFRMDRHHFSQEWNNAPMPYSIFFTKTGDAIHGTDETRHIGRAVSHGCVRLTPAHAAILWDLVKAEGMSKTRVVLGGNIPARGVEVARRQPTPQTYANAPIYAPDNSSADITGSIPAPPPVAEPPGADVAGAIGPPGGGWHAYVQDGRLYYYRDGPQQVQRVYPRGYGDAPPYPPNGW
jgi:L,D-transpeptidase catalytic domain